MRAIWTRLFPKCLLIAVISAGANPILAAVVTASADSAAAIRIDIDNRMLDEELIRVDVNGEKFVRWAQPDHISHESPGQPDIPQIRRLIVVDPKAKYRVKLKRSGLRVLEESRLYPIQADKIETAEDPPFAYDAQTYQKNKWYGSPWVQTGELQKLGRFTVMPITINLARFNPRKKRVEYFETMDIEIKSANQTRTVPVDDPSFISRANITAIETLALNGSSIRRNLTQNKNPGTYLVITSEELLPYAETYARKHEANGMIVAFETVPQGSKSSTVKKIIESYYRSSNLEAVFLLGDERIIPLYYSNDIPGDSAYSLVDGNDGLADILIGRIPASNPAEAELFLQKSELYERGLNQGPETRSVMMIAHRENYPGKYTSNLESIRKSENTKNLSFVTQYGGEQATNQTIIDLSEQDYSIINYRGHGSTQTWSGWGRNGKSFGGNEISALLNVSEKLTIFFNIACSNGGIQSSSDSMAERLLWSRANNGGSNSAPNGAVAVLAATKPSMTDVNNRYNRNLFQYIQSVDAPDLGTLNMLAANKLVRDNNGRIPSNNKMYVLFGDPLLKFKHDQANAAN